jgi:hypothetical protein
MLKCMQNTDFSLEPCSHQHATLAAHAHRGIIMLHWFQKTLISDEAADWIDTCAGWTIEQFGAAAFRQPFWQDSRLVRPDGTDFPEQVSSPEALARYVLLRVTDLASVAHWPWELRNARDMETAAPPVLGLDLQRFSDSQKPGEQPAALVSAHPTLQVPFIVDQITKPQDLVASIAHTCAQHMLWQGQQTPPGGMEYFEQAAEVLAHFCGFGIMLTNSAYTYRGGCGRCYNPRANRRASLSESESLYTLALFCQLKGVPRKTVFQYLKPHLKNSYKLAQKQIRQRPQIARGRSASSVTQTG